MALVAGSFLWFSDFHYDPYYGKNGAYGTHGNKSCPDPTDDIFGQYPCDAPLALIQSAVDAAKNVYAISSNGPEFVIVTGDFSRHGTDELSRPLEELASILNKIAVMLHDAFPDSSANSQKLLVVPTLGNNDFTPDYYVDITQQPNPNLEKAADAFDTYILSKSELATFRLGGFLARNVTDTLTILSINTLIYSRNHKPDQSDMEDPYNQFRWIESELVIARAASRRVYIIGHIPGIVGSYQKDQFWEDRYRDRFNQLVLEDYVDVVAAQLFGHQHSDEFRVFPYQKEESAPMLLGPSITPLFGNNPSFRKCYFDEQARVLDYETYYTDLSVGIAPLSSSPTIAWNKLYSFVAEYDVPDLSVPSLRKIVAFITKAAEDGKGNPLLEKSRSFQQVNTGTLGCDTKQCQFEWVCLLQTGSKNEFDDCLDSFGLSTSSSSTSDGDMNMTMNIIITIAVICIVVILCIGFRSYRKWRARVTGTSIVIQNGEEEDADDIAIELPMVS